MGNSQEFPVPPHEYLSASRQAYNFVTGIIVLGIIAAIGASHRIAYELGLAEHKSLD